LAASFGRRCVRCNSQRLRGDLALNRSGTVLALDLLDELETLRARVRVLEHQLGAVRVTEFS
jgi:chaperone modulatory protein CbpM